MRTIGSRFATSKRTRRAGAGLAAVALLASIGASGALAGGPPGLAFYVDDVQYRTVGTPTDLFGTGAPAWTYDAIYALGEGLDNVAEAKPGDTDFNGGRWLVYPVTWADNVMPYQYTNVEDLLEAAELGDLTIGDPIKSFVCPVIRVPGRA